MRLLPLPTAWDGLAVARALQDEKAGGGAGRMETSYLQVIFFCASWAIMYFITFRRVGVACHGYYFSSSEQEVPAKLDAKLGMLRLFSVSCSWLLFFPLVRRCTLAVVPLSAATRCLPLSSEAFESCLA